MERTFTISGRIFTEDPGWTEGASDRLDGEVVDLHEPWGRAFIQIIDLDRFRNDLIAEGHTRDDGTFDLEFLTSEFNQDPGEHETLPNPWLIVSRMTDDGDRIPVESCGIAWSSDRERHAEVTVAIDVRQTSLPATERVPTATSHGHRLNLTDELVRVLTDEIAPVVSRLTGWDDLTADLQFEVADDMRSHAARMLGDNLNREAPQIAGAFADRHLITLYEPVTKTILVNKRADELNSDGLRVILGHELVYAGQYRECAGLLDRVRAASKNLLEELELNDDQIGALRDSEAHRIMTLLEGQASWVQRRLFYDRPLADVDMPSSTFGRLIRAVAAHSGLEVKPEEYSAGARSFEDQTTAGGSIATLPGWLISGTEPSPDVP